MALKSLIDGLNRTPELFDLKIEMEAFFTDLQELKEEQKQKVLACRQISNELDLIRQQASTFLYANLVDLISKYIDESEKVMQYFNIGLLTPRKPKKSRFVDLPAVTLPMPIKDKEITENYSEEPVG
jgi:hypothetical protein